MPSATSTIGFTLANAGPAPATYSLAASCTESSFQIATTTSENPAWANQCSDTAWNAKCGIPPTDSALAKEMTSNWYIIPYYSPGPSCPDGWKTVGAVGRPGQGPVTSSGLLKADDYDDYLDVEAGRPYAYKLRNVFGALLDPEETVIACCPSSMTVGSGTTSCYSTLPPRPISTGCVWEYARVYGSLEPTTTSFVLHGVTTTGVLKPKVPTTLMTPTPVITTFSDSETSGLIPVSAAGPIYLMHKPSDVSGSNPDTDAGTNTASALRVDWSTRGIKVVGALTVSFALGMALVLPW
ncbi:hypothetical protein ASPVEDRAFT_180870 [Aspergillus versicolor CBS 583.65]|uniref:Uncharacterized protein n=1 Tax=Aspergillus versicolor CBS 583.65 TaxID=1036611 RepID=A0A1L9P2T8_ASPVE|nr:uncharacterized protein ASPVEDRAFT_180870 [Aspergillus versicolor CBS 583.65]OJI95816.1 hypothetical protein ASPVEDRAFT_180870 [Aspergillus versicolor CBS 583.65]